MSEKLSAHEERMHKVREFCLTKQPVSPYSSNEMKKELPSYCKVSSMAVGDLIKDSADADLIHAEKIGISTYYWMFPSEESSKVKKKNDDLKAKLASMKKELSELTKSRDLESNERQETEERQDLMNQFKTAQTQRKENIKLIELYRQNDPKAFNEFLGSLNISKAAANRWTDNIYAVIAHIKKQTGMRQGEILKMLNFPQDLDYIE